MAKLPANWSAKDGSSTATQSGNGELLQESNFEILQEDGVSSLLVEDILLTPKEASKWDDI